LHCCSKVWMAWLWSGVATETASKFYVLYQTFLASPYNILLSEKHLHTSSLIYITWKEIFAFPLLSNIAMSDCPFPPTPILAINNRSLGATNPLPNTTRNNHKMLRPPLRRFIKSHLFCVFLLFFSCSSFMFDIYKVSQYE
jgi:hypothetical protein